MPARHLTLPVALLLSTAVLAQSPASAARPALTWKEGLATPESVLHDAATDTYLVSNINGNPTAKDNNGYILELSPDGKAPGTRLVEGGQTGVTLHAPKGTAVVGGILYVADIDTVRLFDRKTGAPRGEVKVPGATFVNDVAEGPGGLLYISDSGLKPDFSPSGTDAVYVLRPGKKPTLKPLVKGAQLKSPNGLAVTAEGLWVATYGANEVQRYTLKGAPSGPPLVLPKGGLDGLVLLGASLLVSSWEGAAVYQGPVAGGDFTAVVSGVKAPADFGFDSKRRRILVPRFQEDLVEAWELP